MGFSFWHYNTKNLPRNTPYTMTHIPPIRSDYAQKAPDAFMALSKLSDPTESWAAWRAMIQHESLDTRIPLDLAMACARSASALWGIESAAECLEIYFKTLESSMPRSASLASSAEWAAIAVHCAMFNRDPRYAPQPAMAVFLGTPPISACIGKRLAAGIRDLEDNPANHATLGALARIEIHWGIGRLRIFPHFETALKERFTFYNAALVERILDQAKARTQAALSFSEAQSIGQSISADEKPIRDSAPSKSL